MIFNGKKTIGSALVIIMVVSPILWHTTIPEIANAQYSAEEEIAAGVAACALSALIVYGLGQLSGLAGISVPTMPGGLTYKETLLDCAAWVVNDVLITTITIEMVNWINTGLDGNSFYVKNLNSELAKYADEVAGRFLDEYGISEYVCSPFRIPIQIALSKKYSDGFEQIASCTLTEAFNNVNNPSVYTSGSFYEIGGWEGFKSISRPENNPYGAYLLAEQELNKQVANKVDTEITKLKFNSGIKSAEVCEDVLVQADGPPNPDGTFPMQIEEVCEVATPGQVIISQLNKVLGLGNDRLVQAEELGEVLQGILTQILLQTFASPEGLAGFDPDNINPLGDYSIVLDPPTGTAQSCNTDLGAGSSVVSASFLENAPYVTPGIGVPPIDKRFSINQLDGHYARVEVDMDFYISEFQPDPWEKVMPIITVRNVGGNAVVPNPSFHASLEKNLLVVAFQQARWGSGINSITRVNVPGGWDEQSWYHAHIDYRAPLNETTLTVTRGRGLGGSVVATAVTSAHHTMFPQGDGIKVIVSGENHDENVAHMAGSQYENIDITFTPGVPLCRVIDGRPQAGSDQQGPTPPSQTP
jgi:hypothetical protein